MIDVLAKVDIYAWIAHYGIVLLRVGSLFVFLPIFSSRLLPVKIRAMIAAVLAFVFLPLAPQLTPPPMDALGWVTVALRELGAGFGLGIAAKAVFAGIEAAAQLISGQSGFALASMVDPASGDQTAATNIFINLLAISVFLAADLHHMFLRAVVSSYEILPPSMSLPALSGMHQSVSALGLRMFTLSVELAAPALVVTVAVDLVMVLVGKAMPSIPILIVGYPFKMALGLVALGVLAVATGETIGWIGRTIASDGAAVLSALAGS